MKIPNAADNYIQAVSQLYLPYYDHQPLLACIAWCLVPRAQIMVAMSHLLWLREANEQGVKGS